MVLQHCTTNANSKQAAAAHNTLAAPAPAPATPDIEVKPREVWIDTAKIRKQQNILIYQLMIPVQWKLNHFNINSNVFKELFSDHSSFVYAHITKPWIEE